MRPVPAPTASSAVASASVGLAARRSESAPIRSASVPLPRAATKSPKGTTWSTPMPSLTIAGTSIEGTTSAVPRRLHTASCVVWKSAWTMLPKPVT